MGRTFLYCFPVRVGAILTTFTLACLSKFISMVIGAALSQDQFGSNPNHWSTPGSRLPLNVANCALIAFTYVFIVGLLAIGVRSPKMVWGYKTFIAVISPIVAVAGITALVMFFINLQKISWGALIANGNECVELIQKDRRENPDGTKEDIPEACLLLAHSLSDVIISLVWSGFLCSYYFWNACAYNAVSGYYKELAEEVDCGIPLKPTADDVLPSYDESLSTDQGDIRI